MYAITAFVGSQLLAVRRQRRLFAIFYDLTKGITDMSITLKIADKGDIKSFKSLYFSAFPKNERQPFCLLKSRAKSGRGELHIARDGETFVGFAYVITYLDMAYLFYFAIDGELRGKGYGSEILTELKRIYEGKRLFLARETLDEGADNYDQRVKRHSFYLKNGFSDLPAKIEESSVVFDVMGIGGTVKAEEYGAMMTAFCGKIIRRIAGMRLIEE